MATTGRVNNETWAPSAGIVMPKTSGVGIKVDSTSPAFGWKDLIGQITPHATGGTAPSSVILRSGGNVRGWAFSANDVIDDITFHMPHDYAPGTDLYAHVHWTHVGTAISGSLVLHWYVTYCKGYNQSSQTFFAEKDITQTITTASTTTYPQYGHFIEEFALSNANGDSTHLDRSTLEVDGLIKIGIKTTTVPTITGAYTAAADEPFILMIDLHYQSTQMTTKQRTGPTFYT